MWGLSYCSDNMLIPSSSRVGKSRRDIRIRTPVSIKMHSLWRKYYYGAGGRHCAAYVGTLEAIGAQCRYNQR